MITSRISRPSSRRYVTGLLAGAFALYSGATIAAAEDSTAPAFIPGASVQRAIAVGESAELNLTILHAGAVASPVRLVVIPGETPSGAQPLALAAAPMANGTIVTSDLLTPGEHWSAALPVSGVVAGHYTGTIIAVDSLGGFDTVDVVVDVAEREAALASDVLRAPLPDPLTLQVTRLGPGPVWFPILPPTLDLDPSLVSGAAVGPLLNEAGSTMSVALSPGGRISIDSTPATGTFQGGIGRAGSDEVTKVASLQVKVRDVVLWPILVILFGIALAVLGDDLVERWMPRHQLRLRLASLRERSSDITKDMRTRIGESPVWHGSDREPIGLVGDGSSGMLWDQSQEALADFDDQPSGELRRSRWGPAGTEWIRVRGFVEQQQWADDAAVELNDQVGVLQSRLGSAFEAFPGSAIGSRLGAALSGGVVEGVADLERRYAERTDIQERVSEIIEIATGLDRIGAMRDATDDDRKALGDLRRKLAGLPVGTQASIAAIGGEGMEIYESILRRTAEAARELDDRGGTEDDEIRMYLSAASGVDTGGGGLEPEDAGLTPAQIRAQVRTAGRVLTAATVMAVLVAGVATQYLTNVTFGSLADYAGLLVWATAAAAAGQVVKVLGLARVSRSLAPVPSTGQTVGDVSGEAW